MLIKTILCADDDPDNLEILRIIFQEEGFYVKVCDSLEDCVSYVYENSFAAIILDKWFGSVTSESTCREIRSVSREIPIIYYSASAMPTDIDDAVRSGASAYISKPDFDKLIETVCRLV